VKKKLLIGLIAVFCLALAAAAFAEEREDGQAKSPLQTRKEVVKLKYIRAADAFQLLRAYSTLPREAMGPNSVFLGGNIVMSKDANQNEILVLTDLPEVVEKMLALIKEIDVRPAEIQFMVQIVVGSEASEDKGDEALKNDPVIRELRGVLKYKAFSMLDGTTLRVIEGERAEAKVGTKGEYSLRLVPKLIRDGATETIRADVEFYRPVWAPLAPNSQNAQMMNNDLVRTTLMLKPGEKTVVGVSKSDADKGLILIISGKVTK
jgi:hypothetical protein